MGTIARYLIPIDSKLSAAEYADKAMKVLLQMEVISESEERSKELLYNGKRSTEPFQIEPDDGECGFDMASVFGGPGFIIAPEEYVEAVFCPRCNENITPQWGPKIRGEEDGLPIKYDSKDVQVSCPKCGAACRLDQVKASEAVDKFYFIDRFVNFWDCRAFKPEWIAEFDRQMGCHHETFDYWWT